MEITTDKKRLLVFDIGTAYMRCLVAQMQQDEIQILHLRQAISPDVLAGGIPDIQSIYRTLISISNGIGGGEAVMHLSMRALRHKKHSQHLQQFLVHTNLQQVKMISYPKIYGFLLRDYQQPVCLIDIGAGRTDFVLYNQGKHLHHGSLNIAGNSITDEIQTVFNLQCQQAEQLKIFYGNALGANASEQQQKLASLVKDSYCEIFSAIKQEIDQILRVKVKILLSGAGSYLHDVEKICSKIFSSAVEQATPPITHLDDARYTALACLTQVAFEQYQHPPRTNKMTDIMQLLKRNF